MGRTLRARYHNGMLEPLEPLPLSEGEVTTIALVDSDVPWRGLLKDMADIDSVELQHQMWNDADGPPECRR